MVFNNVFFIFAFLPLALAMYRYIPNQMAKNVVLLIMSYIFYAWGNPVNLLLIVLLTCWNFVTVKDWANKSDKKVTQSFIFTIVLNVLVLCTYRYTNQIIDLVNTYFETSIRTIELSIPFGLSFFVFSSISYLADVYTEKSEPQDNLILYALYVSFFGKAGSGPIVQYNEMEESLSDHLMTTELLAKGSAKFVRGLVKKVIFADQLAMMIASLANNHTVLGAWLTAIGFMLQIYFDFSGYSDMAIGIGNMFGFDWKENFDHPYLATSIQEFWRKWHISLYSWFKNYIYIPLGGSQVSTLLWIHTMFLIWILTGIWHGANLTYLIWGIYNCLLLLLERFFLKNILEKNKKLSHALTLLFVLLGWIMFMSPDIFTAIETYSNMLGMGSGFLDSVSLFALRSYLLILILSCLFCTELYSRIETILTLRFRGRSILINLIVYFALFVVCIACIIGNSYHAFLYFTF
ncbi:MAG: MBOAT family O-acyltransferase [Bacillota bacterium]|nr:MBOAT family O-acyltransferase [Bacillota bacterium]